MPDIPIFQRQRQCSDSSNKKDALEAKIGYWYAISKNKKSNKGLGICTVCFLGKASEIGYEQGKKSYKQTEKNDLQEFGIYDEFKSIRRN